MKVRGELYNRKTFVDLKDGDVFRYANVEDVKYKYYDTLYIKYFDCCDDEPSSSWRYKGLCLDDFTSWSFENDTEVIVVPAEITIFGEEYENEDEDEDE